MKHWLYTVKTGDEILQALQALSNPHRLRILAALTSGGRNYVSRLARDVGISRPLLHLHLQKLHDAGLVSSKIELSDDGKALSFYQITDFDLRLTAEIITSAVTTLTDAQESKD